MTVDLNNGMDYWPVMGEQVEELRRRYNILPAEAFLPVPVRWLQVRRETKGCRCVGTCRLGGEWWSAHRALFGADAKSPLQLPLLRWTMIARAVERRLLSPPSQ